MTFDPRVPAEFHGICLTENDTPEFDRSRFWGKVDRGQGADGCWLWRGARANNGYGMFKLGGKSRTAHRLSLYMHTGRFGEVAQHSCDNKACVNPAHLSWSTQRDNVHDAIAKGRHGQRKPKPPKPPRRPGQLARIESKLDHLLAEIARLSATPATGSAA